MFTGGQVHEYIQGDSVFYIRPLDPFLSVNLLGDLTKTLSPIAGKASAAAVGGDKGKGKQSIFDTELNAASIEGIFTAIAENVDGAKIESLIKRILNEQYVSVRLPGQEAVRLTREVIAELFTGNAQDMLMLAFEVLKVNYGGFTKLFRSLSGNVPDLLKRER